MNSKYSTISKQTIDINPYWNYVIEEYILPDFNIGKYYYVESNGSTIIIPKLSNGNFLLTKQFRYLNKKFSLEFPGGGIKKVFWLYKMHMKNYNRKLDWLPENGPL